MSDPVLIAIIAAAPLMGGQIVAAWFSYKANLTARETHAMVNSRLELFMENFKAASHAEGVAQERSESRLRTGMAAQGALEQQKLDKPPSNQ